MTIGGALSDLSNLLNADDIPYFYKPSIKAVMDVIKSGSVEIPIGANIKMDLTVFNYLLSADDIPFYYKPSIKAVIDTLGSFEIPTGSTTKNDLADREFEGIEVNYPPEKLCTYPEYKGKPYFGIKYKENGKEIVGYGTYKPEILSQYLKDYFISTTRKIEQEPCEDAVSRQAVIELDLDYVIKQKYIEREVLDKIKEIVDKWRSDTWTDNLSHECMAKIAELVDSQKSEGEK